MDEFVIGGNEIRMSFDLESGLRDASATAVDTELEPNRGALKLLQQ